MQITFQTVDTQVVNLTEDQVKQVAVKAILSKLGLTENYRVIGDQIHDDYGPVENVFERFVTEADRSAFATIALILK
ncbi:hypothetical protein [Rheinheimera hassiensis]|uniref:hypothetical protein n=1 Tax=Rheinheimera hassiensis TaxID=1193627 RepID=UPI001F0616EB|nr:hypothetical protein [Rheinheimera hassiensis]